MSKKALVLISFIVAICLHVSCQEHKKLSEQNSAIDAVLGVWTHLEYPDPKDLLVCENSWGEGVFLPNEGFIIDRVEPGSDQVFIDPVGIGFILVKRIEKVSDGVFSLIVERNSFLSKESWPEEGEIIITIINAREIYVDDSDFPVFGIVLNQGTYYKLAGPKLQP